MKMKNILVAGVAFLLAACTQPVQKELTLSGLKTADFQTEISGKKTDLFVLKNANGMEVCITNFGGRIVSIMVPGKDGAMRDIVHGFDSVQDYMKHPTDFGATIGRYANRINQGKITVEGVEYQLPQNNYGHCLHGGPNGFQYVLFDVVNADGRSLTLSYTSKDGEEGFPGNLTCQVTFTLTDDNAIDISYGAETDRTTVVNMTNHSYFNLSGDPNNTICDHILYVNADNFTPVDDTYMTTGEILTVKETPMDFTTPKAVGADIDNFEFEQVKFGNGFDHNWVLNTQGDVAQLAAKLTSPTSGISVEVYTNEPGIQVYSGNFLDGTATGKKGIVYNQRTGFCLESQKYPDSPNKNWAESNAYLEPGQTYFSQCIFKFTVEK